MLNKISQKILKVNVEMQLIMRLQIYQTASINKTGRIGDWKPQKAK